MKHFEFRSERGEKKEQTIGEQSFSLFIVCTKESLQSAMRSFVVHTEMLRKLNTGNIFFLTSLRFSDD